MSGTVAIDPATIDGTIPGDPAAVEAEIDARMKTLAKATSCEYSAAHVREGIPATSLIHAPALRDRWPHGIPVCDACRHFYTVNA